MISIIEAAPNDFPIIRDIAYKTWPITYGHILPEGQIDYMLERMYSIDSLHEATQKGHRFLLFKENEEHLGFAGYEHRYLDANVTRLHKLYVLPETQGRGVGRILIDAVEKLANENRSDAVSLNVNRFNNAFLFYLKLNYEVVGEENIDIGNGYLMEDYKLEKKL
jgi:ribosomal protein S18 acetylase RimI-like enzyme